MQHLTWLLSTCPLLTWHVRLSFCWSAHYQLFVFNLSADNLSALFKYMICGGVIELNPDFKVPSMIISFKICLPLRQWENPTDFLVYYDSGVNWSCKHKHFEVLGAIDLHDIGHLEVSLTYYTCESVPVKLDKFNHFTTLSLCGLRVIEKTNFTILII